MRKLKSMYQRFIVQNEKKKELLETLVQSTLSIENNSLKLAGQKLDPKNIAYNSYQHLSQSDEDGIINNIFNCLNTPVGKFIEIGVGDGKQNNTASLLYQGWCGLWIEGSKAFSEQISMIYADAIKKGKLDLRNSFVTVDNIIELINGFEEDVDLLSIDIDGNDFAILSRLLTKTSPKVIVAEYNAKFGPEIKYCMRYDENYAWQGGTEKDDKFGVSYKYLKNGLERMNYTIVTCNLAGTNAFFVRNDYLQSIEKILPEKDVFQPARYHLTKIENGHPHGTKTYASSLS